VCVNCPTSGDGTPRGENFPPRSSTIADHGSGYQSYIMSGGTVQKKRPERPKLVGC